MKKALLVASLLVVVLLSGSLVVMAQTPGTIADIVVSSTTATTPEFTILLAAVQAADPALITALSNPEAGLTVFAPTDAAFAAAFESMGVTPEQVLADQAALTDILLYHVVPGVFTAENIVALDGALLGTSLYETALNITLEGEAVLVNGAEVVAADVTADNGVVHVIDSVLIPPAAMDSGMMATEDAMMMATEDAMMMATEDPMMMMEMGTITDIVVNSTTAEAPEFLTLLAAVQAADPSVLESLTNGGPFTVFAPTDAAFAAALEALGLTAEELLADTTLLTTVLAYHVVPGHFSASTIVTVLDMMGTEGVRVATLNPGTTVTVTAGDAGVLVNTANVIATDVYASNGVVHVIDAVLLPPM